MLDVFPVKAIPLLRREPYEISGLQSLAADIRATGGVVMAEIGIYAGESTRIFLEAGLAVHAIEPWSPESLARLHEGAVAPDGFPDGLRPIQPEKDPVSVCLACLQRLRPWLSSPVSPLRLHRGFDYEIRPLFAAQSLDAVYIDAIHTREELQTQIERWLPAIRPGGWICGHDYNEVFPDVVKLVDELFPYRITYEDSSWSCRLPK